MLALRLGESSHGALALDLEAGSNRARSSFRLTLTGGTPVTISAESYDFDAALSVEEVNGSRTWHAERGGVYTNAELEIVEPPTELLVHVHAEDAYGGEFSLAARAGPRSQRMARDAWIRASAEHCERAAERAFARSDARLGLRLLSEAWQYAHELGDVERARRIAEVHADRARAEQAAGEILRARAHLGMTERRAGAVTQARELLDDAIAGLTKFIAELATDEERRPWLRLACQVHAELGLMAMEADDWDDAGEHYRLLAELAARAQDARFEVLSWERQAVVHDETGELADASAAAERALVQARALGDSELLARASATHARVQVRRGELRAAQTELEGALAIDASPPVRSMILGTLGEVYLELARYEAAICTLDELDRWIAEHGLSGDVFPAQLLRARIAIGLGELPRARRMLEESLESASNRGHRRDQARALLNLGALAIKSGDLDASEVHLQAARALAEEIGDRSLTMRALLDLCELADSRREFGTALERLERARELASHLGSRRYAHIVQGALAHVLCRSGEPQKSRAMARECAVALEEMGEFEAAADARETLARVALSLSDTADVRAEIDAGERLLARCDTSNLDATQRAGVRSRNWTFGALAQDIVPLERTAARSEPDGQRALDAGIASDNRWKGRMILEGIGAREPSIAIPSGSPPLHAGMAWINYSDGLDRLYGTIATPRGLSFHDLGERESIERDVRAFVDGLATTHIDPAQFAAQAARLYDRLLSPLLAQLDSPPRELVVFPTPALSILPFDALVSPASERAWDRRGFTSLRCVVDDMVVAQLPSVAVYSALCARPNVNRPTRVLVVGDPLYFPELASPPPEVASAQRVGESLIDYARIKATRDEAFAIADLMLERNSRTTDADRASLQSGRRQRDFTLSTEQMDLFLGASASLEKFGSKLGDCSLLHVAAHGHVDAVDPRRSGLVLAYEPRGAGLWTLASVLNQSLTAELVVLSACDTASGPIVRGDGIQSVAHAFLAAGARSVVATLWRVDDRDSAELMKEFYGRFLEQAERPAHALRSAKLALRGSSTRGKPAGAPDSQFVGTHPHTWAPYIFVGAP